jgi:UDP-N-acetylglucosamine transferase subunit ALG13
VVSLGTERWPFDRAVSRCREVLDGLDITWQTGTTRAVDGHGRRLAQWLPASELHEAFRCADVVVTHAGVGSVLAVLRQGKVPVVLPRRAGRGEMVDDHQVELAAMVTEKGLAVAVDADDLRAEHLLRAAGSRVLRRRPDAGQMPLPSR